jgi:glutamate-1-semialdehyde aminotransferase
VRFRGLTAIWSLEPDLITLGKFIGGGIPIGTYGMSAELSDVFERPDPKDPHQEIASGGTLFANALSMAAGRATLSEVMTAEAYAHAAELGACSQTAASGARGRSGSPGGITVSTPAPATPTRTGCRETPPSTTSTPTQS